MEGITIRTNNVPRDVIEAYELTAEERAQFDYIDWPAVDRLEESPQFFRYKGELHDLGEFMVWDNPASPTRGEWDGFRSDSYFSGLAVRYVDDGERVVVAMVMS
jgi:hypothetical protein